LKYENPINSSVEFPVNTVCCLARFEKIRMTQQRVARIENFDALQAAPTKSSGLSFPQKVQTFREERKV
jgi:hypothetical protein